MAGIHPSHPFHPPAPPALFQLHQPVESGLFGLLALPGLAAPHAEAAHPETGVLFEQGPQLRVVAAAFDPFAGLGHPEGLQRLKGEA